MDANDILKEPLKNIGDNHRMQQSYFNENLASLQEGKENAAPKSTEHGIDKRHGQYLPWYRYYKKADNIRK